MLAQDVMQDFYPPNVGAPYSYVPPMSDNSPQAQSMPVTGRNMSNMSTAMWAAGFIVLALIVMHVTAE